MIDDPRSSPTPSSHGIGDASGAREPGRSAPATAALAGSPVAGGPSGRRRFLTRGLVGGPVALMAATRPIETLAQSTTGCSTFSTGVSVGSASHRAQAQNCTSGFSPSNYQASKKWPGAGNSGFTTKGGAFVPVTLTTPFNNIFVAGNFSSLSSFFVPTLTSGDEIHFVTALLNSLQVIGYPYGPDDIVDLWNHPNAHTASSVSQVANFFAMHLEG